MQALFRFAVIGVLLLGVAGLFMGQGPAPLPASGEVYAWSVSVYAFILVIAHIREVDAWIHDRETQALRLESELADAKIQRVMLELRPNVLLDALRNLEVTIGNDPLRAEKSLADIGEFLRLTLDGMYYREIRVRDECASVRAYARVLAIATCPELTARQSS